MEPAEKLFSRHTGQLPVITRAVPTAEGYLVRFTFGDALETGTSSPRSKLCPPWRLSYLSVK